MNHLDDAGAMTRHFRKLAGYLRADDLRDGLWTDTTWFNSTTAPEAEDRRFVFAWSDPKRTIAIKSAFRLYPLSSQRALSVIRRIWTPETGIGWRLTPTDV